MATLDLSALKDMMKLVNDVPSVMKTAFATGDADFMKDAAERRFYPLPDYPEIGDEISLMRKRTPTKIIESDLLTVPAEDWSHVRSPGRARRRLKRGFKQNIHHYQKPSPDVLSTPEGLIMHPAIAQQLRALVEQKDKAMLNALYGRL